MTYIFLDRMIGWIKFKVSVVVYAIENIPGKKRSPILVPIPWVH